MTSDHATTGNVKPAVERVHPPQWLMRVVNPATRALVRRGRGRPTERFAVLEFTGRRSGKAYAVPVGYRVIDGHGVRADQQPVAPQLRRRRRRHLVRAGHRHPAHADLMDDPAAVAALYDRLIGEIGWRKAGRELGVRINVDRRPTLDELEDAVRRSGPSAIWLDERET